MANDYIDLLNSLPVIKLLHAKWERGARGHFFGQLALFCTSLVFHTLLCQHRRQGLVDVFNGGRRDPLLKAARQSLDMCRPPYSEVVKLANGTKAMVMVGAQYTFCGGGLLCTPHFASCATLKAPFPSPPFF